MNRPVAAPSAPNNASRCATTEPLPLVPATVITGKVGAATPRARATALTRSSPISMLLGCTDSCSVSHSASVRICEGRRVSASGGLGQLQQQSQERGDLVAHLAAIDDHVDRTVIEQELTALEALGQRLAHRLLDHARTGKADDA